MSGTGELPLHLRVQRRQPRREAAREFAEQHLAQRFADVFRAERGGERLREPERPQRVAGVADAAQCGAQAGHAAVEHRQRALELLRQLLADGLGQQLHLQLAVRHQTERARRHGFLRGSQPVVERALDAGAVIRDEARGALAHCRDQFTVALARARVRVLQPGLVHLHGDGVEKAVEHARQVGGRAPLEQVEQIAMVALEHRQVLAVRLLASVVGAVHARQ